MAGSWLMRHQGHRMPGLALSTIGAGSAVAAAWLGGDLAYNLGIGVNHAAFEKPPSDWIDVAALRGLPDGKPRRIDVDGTPVLLLRQGDRIRAIGATCPHLAGPLDEGTIEGDTVTCPWHGSVFSLVDGALMHGPAMQPVAAYEVQVKDGRIEIRANAEQSGTELESGAAQR
jgi:nitrite reductase/ring-hydroxylating ferredoxin subunit